MLAIGKKAPAIALPDKNDVLQSIDFTKHDYTVLYFYPKDDTPGCTIETREFDDSLSHFSKVGARVVGISGGNAKTKTKFCEKYGLSLELLSDTDFAVSKKYEVYGEKKFMGRAYMGIYRTTLLVDSKGAIRHIFEDVTPEGHALQVLTAIAALSAGEPVPETPALLKKKSKKPTAKAASSPKPKT